MKNIFKIQTNHNPLASAGPDGVTMKCYFLSLKTLSGPADAVRFFDLNPQGFENLEGFSLRVFPYLSFQIHRHQMRFAIPADSKAFRNKP